MKRSLLICLSVLLALAAVAATALAMEIRSVPETNPVAPAVNGSARIAVAHLAPFSTTTAVNIRIDGMPVPQLANLEFGDSTPYITVPTGTHLVEIYLVGSPTPALTTTVNLEDQDYTAIAIGGARSWPLELRLLQDDNTAPPTNTAKVRVGHLAPFATAITDTLADVRLQDGTSIPGATGVPYGVIGPYTPLLAMPYNLKITSPGGAVTLIDPLLVTFSPGDILSLFAVGDGANQPLGVFALPSGQPGALLPLANYHLFLPIVARDAAP